MQVVVLTGGIACGKSAAESFFRELGVPVIDADTIAREITQADSPYYTQIIDHFGPAVCDKDNTLNRKALAHHIFNNPIEKKWLEALLHPPILAHIKQRLEALRQHPTSSPYCLITIPLLAEMNTRPNWINTVIVLVCPPLLQLQRLLHREPHDSISSARAKIQAQTNTNNRLKLADYTLHNDGTLADLKAQVYHLHQYLIRKASKRK